ncbi:hypothetical protein DZA28_17900 [Pseudomonas alloputida]|jgi:hypothetical protein|uniref:NAD(P)H-flavin reductase n=2 Tax=Pseudomonas TaxID=286 RepID=A0ABD6N2S1_9PSED|nr:MULTISPECIES: hypothetical protein [Pseudomonas]ANI03652.1 hypothetical protein A210_13725 [Pseudomonas putida SJTE-1]EKT4475181.1 hypothetical protein [Pseudomonas putida]MDD2140788.1 hypothetical protein [Pseudomonas putida]MDD2148027.1 hypothetical protein [Pseudomonas putida]NWL46675.1 hypothetical protein [Pseudomonas hunanensis]
MDREGASVRLLQTLPGLGIQQFVRLALCSQPCGEAMAGQYCVLSGRTECWPCSYVTLPGVAGQFIVSTQSAQPVGRAGELLDYSGPLGSAWPLPLQSTRLLAISRADGLLPLLGALDEIRCWLPWLQLQLSHDGIAAELLPDDCRTWLSALSPLSRDYSSGWWQTRHLLTTFRPDTVYCCAPPQVARQVARLCWQTGVAAQRIWIRTDHVSRPIWVGHSPESWPVQRYDRVLAALKWAPPGGSG